MTVTERKPSRSSWALRVRSGGGFSLIELLVVISIIVLMASLMGPTLNTALRGNAMTQAADKVIGILSLAHQTAVTRNQTVEVRFYTYIDPEIPGDTGQGRALQAFTVDDAGTATPIVKAQVLPPTMVMTTNSTLSTIFAGDLTSKQGADAGNGIKLPRVGTKYTYVSFQFYRSGATSLLGQATQSPWCVTLENIQDSIPAKASRLPQNFTTIVIDPYNGALKTFRPTL